MKAPTSVDERVWSEEERQVTDFESAHVMQHQAPKPGVGCRVPGKRVRKSRWHTQSCRVPGRDRGSRSVLLKICQKRVWTMSTVSASDRIVHRSDGLGLPMFSRFPSVFKGRNAVRVPPRARFPMSGALLGPLMVWTMSTPCPLVPYDGYRSLRVCRRPFLWPDAFLP
jgi:hypothetical protein